MIPSGSKKKLALLPVILLMVVMAVQFRRVHRSVLPSHTTTEFAIFPESATNRSKSTHSGRSNASSSDSTPAMAQQDTTPTAVETVAYVVSITSCFRKKSVPEYSDLAAVLKKSIELNSHPLHPTAKYASKLYVLVLPELKNSHCVQALLDLGFVPRHAEVPVKRSQIRKNSEDSVLREKIFRDGCCGMNELVKLQVYGMTDHPVAIHLDLDTLLVQPLDPIIDAMIGDSSRRLEARKRLFADAPPINHQANATGVFPYPRLASPTYQPPLDLHDLAIDAYYTKDYNMYPRKVQEQGGKVAIQGGFLMVRPNVTTLQELVGMVRSGEYYPGRDGRSGWFRSGYGMHIHGSMTIQGLLAYYYGEVRPSQSVELNRCRFNQIADNPRRSSIGPKFPKGTPFWTNATYHDADCRDGRANCDDVQCQTWPIQETYLIHYTYCGKPSACADAGYDETLHHQQCAGLWKEWFRFRTLVAEDRKEGLPNGTYFLPVYQGFCDGFGRYNGFPSRPH